MGTTLRDGAVWTTDCAECEGIGGDPGGWRGIIRGDPPYVLFRQEKGAAKAARPESHACGPASWQNFLPWGPIAKSFGQLLAGF